jgi:hypothetical protein
VGMKEQIDLFNETLENYLPRQINNAEELSKYLRSKSIFVISIGSNDYLYNYLQPQYYTTSRQYDMDAFGDLLMLELEKHLQVPYFLTFVAFLSVEIKQVDHIFENEESNATNTTISGGSGHGRHRHIYIYFQTHLAFLLL